MEFSRELLFFFSALGAFNGFLLALYFLFFARPKHISHFFLGMLLLAMSIRIGKSVFFHFNPDLAFSYLQFGLSACIFIGPFLYFYIKSMLNPTGIIQKEWKIHLAVLAPVTIIGGYYFPFETYNDLWRNCIISYIYWLWLSYLLLSAYILRHLIYKFLQRKEKIDAVEIWVLGVYIGNVIVWAAYFFWGITSYILGALSFSFMLYLLVMLLIFNKKKDAILFKSPIKYADKKIVKSDADPLLSQLQQLMIQEELYKNTQLKLPDVAQRLNILPHRLSQLLNDNVGKNFSAFINEYRIQAAKKLILTDDILSIEGIGYECGFSSNSNFYAVFKKHTGTTPARFKKEHTQF